jgi:hypothetical protein
MLQFATEQQNEGCMTVSPTENQDVKATEVALEGSTAETPPASQGVTAESPTATEGAKKESLADVIKKAADKAVEESPDSDKGKEGEAPDAEAKPKGEEDAEDKPFTKDDLNNLHSKTRKRVGKLLADVETFRKEAETFKPAAENYTRVVGFLKENNLSMDDANDAFTIMRDIRANPMKALEKLEPLVNQLRQITGAVLPDDLVDDVRRGFITEDRAQELSRHRATTTHQEVLQRDTEEAELRKKSEDAQKAVGDISAALTKWETEWASTDPDYSKKRDEVQEVVELELARAQRENKLPKTKEEAIALASKARKRVEEKLLKFQAPKREVQHVTGRSSPAATMSKPNSLAEAILQKANG